MQNISDEEKSLWDSSIQKNLILEFSNGTTLTNTSIHSESMSLEQTLCDENQLTFGRVSSAVFKVRVVATTESYVGQRLIPILRVSNYSRDLGVFKVESCEYTSDRNYMDITAYDLLYDVLNSDYKEWYNNLRFPMTLKKFRDSFFMEIGIVQIDVILPLDNINLQKNIEPSVLSGKDILEAICEINGCCGTLLTNGRFKYVSLKNISTQLFPSNTLYPSNDLYPKSDIKMSVGQGTYVQGSLSYEDYKVKPINRLQIRTEENDIGVIVGVEEGNEYVIENNFLLQGYSTDELNPIANAILNAISDIEYTPTKVKTRGMIWMELGDYISVVSSRDTIRFPILNRSLRGITALFDTYEAKGSETYTERINGVHSQIKMLRGKSNVLERTLEETKSTIKDLEKDVYSEIRQTADRIELQVNAIQNQVDGKVRVWESSTEPTLTNYPASQWTTDDERKTHLGDVCYVGEKGYKFKMKEDGSFYWEEMSDNDVSKALRDSALALAKAEGLEGELVHYSTTEEMNSAIEESAKAIKLTVSEKYTTTAYVDKSFSSAINTANGDTDNKLKLYSTTVQMNSAIKESARKIELTVSKKYTTTGKTQELESSIKETAEQIQLKVSKGDIASTINQTEQSVKISASKIDLSGYATFSSLNKKGKTSINGENITTGTISADRLDVNGIFAKSITAKGTITGGTFTGGDITCTKGKIGGWKIIKGYIYNGINIGTSGSCGMSSGSSNGGSDDRIFWAGDGAFKVSKDGNAYMSKLTATGMTIKGNSKLNGTLQIQDGAKITSALSAAYITFLPAGIQIYGGTNGVNITLDTSMEKVSISGKLFVEDALELSSICALSSGNYISLQRSSSYQPMHLYGGSATGYSAGYANVFLPSTAGTLATTGSDIRIKKNIKDTKVNAIEYLSKIKLHEFDYTDRNAHWKCGFVANELQELDSNTIIDGSGGVNEDGSVNPLCINDFYLTGYIVKAIQELNEKIEKM